MFILCFYCLTYEEIICETVRKHSLTPFLTLRFYEIYKGMTEECIEAGHQAEFSKLCVKSDHLQVRGVVDSELCHVEVSRNI